jgi:hypothetical protein
VSAEVVVPDAAFAAVAVAVVAAVAVVVVVPMLAVCVPAAIAPKVAVASTAPAAMTRVARETVRTWASQRRERGGREVNRGVVIRPR